MQNGDVCVTVSGVANEVNSNGANSVDGASLNAALNSCGVVQGEESPVTLPLVLDSAERLYLARYWLAERELAAGLQARLNISSDDHSNAPPTELLDQLFPPQPGQNGPDWQRVAAVVASMQRLCVITGGPGTGKTRTVARLLAVLQAQLAQTPRIALLAPTGKAAARLLESLRAEHGELEQQGLSLELPDTASTLHRALGYQPGRPGFKHNAGFPLPFDVVLVDEA